MCLRINGYLVEQRHVRQGSEQTTSEDWPEVDDLLCLVVEADAENEWRNDLNPADAENGVMHFGLLQRCNRKWRLTGLQSLPIGEQFLLVQLGPRLDQPALPSWQASGYQLHRFQAHHSHVVLKYAWKWGKWCGPAVSTYIRMMTPKNRLNSGISCLADGPPPSPS
jgi:hypothetical protein